MILLLIDLKPSGLRTRDEDRVDRESNEEDLDHERGDCGVVCEALESKSVFCLLG